ncbi:MAG: four helix bundle protein, partial [Bacteroidetes bacterium CG_4_8_14_3_um_filter_31_14]
MVKKYLQLNALNAYKTAFNLSNFVWDVVIKWDYFAKNTVGEQFVTAMDSISANIAEGFGRYSKKDKVKFYRYSNGSLKECF